jgi:hypothetical protein
MAPTALNRPREGARHSRKASPSARDLTLGEGLSPVDRFPSRPSLSVALGEAFPECLGVFPESRWQRVHTRWVVPTRTRTR